MIEVDNLVKRYGNHIAVDHLSFTVEQGEVIGFLGPNGAGKSTTMNMITGYIPATEGTVKINGCDINDNPMEAKKSIGYLPEIPPLYPDMRVKEYLSFVADIKKVSKQERSEMIEDIMKLTNIKDMEKRLIRNLSKGYKQRVGIAGALMGYPELIILDEPTVGLDPVQIIEIRDLINELAKKHTIILSSHILSEVNAVCDKVMIINKGKLVVSDTPDNLIRHMQNQKGLALTVKADKETLKAALETLEDDIEQIDWNDKNLTEGNEIVNSLTIYAKDEIDLREPLFYTLAEAKCPIMELSLITMSLEDIFLEVTKEDGFEELNQKAEDETENDKIEEQSEDIGEIKEEETDKNDRAEKEDE